MADNRPHSLRVARALWAQKQQIVGSAIIGAAKTGEFLDNLLVEMDAFGPSGKLRELPYKVQKRARETLANPNDDHFTTKTNKVLAASGSTHQIAMPEAA